MQARITIHAAATERAEAEFIVQTIEEMIGGHSFFSIDSGRARQAPATGLSFRDFAVLYRTEAQSVVLSEALARSGMPFRKHGHDALLADPAVRRVLEGLTASPENLPAGLDTAAHGAMGEAIEEGPIEIARLRLTMLAQACNGDRARFQINRKRKLRHRQRVRALLNALLERRQRPPAIRRHKASSKPPQE